MGETKAHATASSDWTNTCNVVSWRGTQSCTGNRADCAVWKKVILDDLRRVAGREHRDLITDRSNVLLGLLQVYYLDGDNVVGQRVLPAMSKGEYDIDVGGHCDGVWSAV